VDFSYLQDDLESLVLGEIKTTRQFSLTFLRRFPKLRRLYLEKHTKDFEAVGELTALEDPTLRTITLTDLQCCYLWRTCSHWI
jgi:hypothetical protein